MTKIKITDDATNATSPHRSKPDDGTPPTPKSRPMHSKRRITMTSQNFRKKYSNAGLFGIGGKNISIDAPTQPSKSNLVYQSQFAPSFQEANVKIQSKDSKPVSRWSIGKQSSSGTSSDESSLPRQSVGSGKKKTSHEV